MRITYAHVARRAADWSLRLDCLAEGRRLPRDAASLMVVAEKLAALSRGDVVTEPDEDDPIFSTVEGQVVLVFVAYGVLGSKEKSRVKAYLEQLSTVMRALVSVCPENQKVEAVTLADFFKKASDIATELSVMGLRADPVYELLSALG